MSSPLGVQNVSFAKLFAVLQEEMMRSEERLTSAQRRARANLARDLGIAKPSGEVKTVKVKNVVAVARSTRVSMEEVEDADKEQSAMVTSGMEWTYSSEMDEVEVDGKKMPPAVAITRRFGVIGEGRVSVVERRESDRGDYTAFVYLDEAEVGRGKARKLRNARTAAFYAFVVASVHQIEIGSGDTQFVLCQACNQRVRYEGHEATCGVLCGGEKGVMRVREVIDKGRLWFENWCNSGLVTLSEGDTVRTELLMRDKCVLKQVVSRRVACLLHGAAIGSLMRSSETTERLHYARFYLDGVYRDKVMKLMCTLWCMDSFTTYLLGEASAARSLDERIGDSRLLGG